MSSVLKGRGNECSHTAKGAKLVWPPRKQGHSSHSASQHARTRKAPLLMFLPEKWKQVSTQNLKQPRLPSTHTSLQRNATSCEGARQWCTLGIGASQKLPTKGEKPGARWHTETIHGKPWMWQSCRDREQMRSAGGPGLGVGWLGGMGEFWGC